MKNKKQKKKEELIKVLNKSQSWISSSSLSKILNIGERTIRNYIKEINEEAVYQIKSSNKGYKLNAPKKANKKQNKKTEFKMSTRTNYILSQLLLNKDGVSVFDLAEQLYISESTIINNVIPSLKELLNNFNLKIVSQNYQYSLTGDEQDKRKLIGYIITHDNYGYFNSKEALHHLFPEFDLDTVSQDILKICQSSNLFLNNYALNNLLVHLIVMIIRLDSKDYLNNDSEQMQFEPFIEQFEQKNEILNVAEKIQAYFKETFNCIIPERDYSQLVFLISLSAEYVDYQNIDIKNFYQFIDQDFFEKTIDLINEMYTIYNIPTIQTLHDNFLLQFVLHIYNMYQRALFKISYPNPLTKQIKKDYAPVYDMAIYFAHRFSLTFDVNITEDEVAFIAFHIGSYLERNKNKDKRITCIIIIEKYRDFSTQLVESIEKSLSDELFILNVMSYNRFMSNPIDCDLLISTIDINYPHQHKVLVNPMLRKQNILDIWYEIESIEKEKKKQQIEMFLERTIDERLYMRNIYLNSVDEYIRYIGNKCLEEDFIEAAFIDDVILREKLSSTAFTEYLAIPHTVGQYAKKTFISVLHNDEPINWGNRKVNFVLMVGIKKEDMVYFHDAVDFIVEAFSSIDKTLKLLDTDTFETFKKIFMSM